MSNSNNQAIVFPAVPISLSGFVMGTIANVLWGTTFLASKYTLRVWNPFTATCLRFALALGAMAILFPMFRTKISVPKRANQWAALLAIGVFGFGGLYPLQLSGLKLIPSALSGAIMMTSPLFLILIGALSLGERLTVRKILAIGIGIAGGTLLLRVGNLDSVQTGSLLRGSVLTVAASVCLALSVVVTRKVGKGFSTADLTFWPMLIGFLVLLPFAYQEKGSITFPEMSHSAPFYSLLYLAIICSAGCFLIWNRALQKSAAKDIASTMHLKTPVAVLMGLWIAGENLSYQMILGTAIVMLGVCLSQTEKRKASA